MDSARGEVDLMQLGLQELTQHKQRCDQELNVIQESIQSLKMAQEKFQESKNNLDKTLPSHQGSTLMVPLTGSMYVRGKILDSQSFIVNIGTGYYVRKDIESAKDYLSRRVKYVTEQLEKLQVLGSDRHRVREAILEVIQLKVRSITAQKESESKNKENE